MDVRLLLLCLVLFDVLLVHQVVADFYYNRISPKKEELAYKGLKCIPGRTVLKMDTKDISNHADDGGETEGDEEETRRTHMNHEPKDETCLICVCSMEGKDESCSKRPTRNVNECLRIVKVVDDFKRNIPYDHGRVLSYAIRRRDYIWHKDEIPYNPKAKCRRGMSYYSNSLTANDTDIEVPSDIESLLDYHNKGVCWYCVCSVHGDSVGCIKRDTWFCDYYKKIREPGYPRHMYAKLFGQDRPAYFSFLSQRIRRTMDAGIFDLLENVGNDINSNQCVPFVSQYTDCTEANICTGCKKCDCTVDGQWSCEEVKECDGKEMSVMNEDTFDNALQVITSELKQNKKPEKTKKHLDRDTSLLLVRDPNLEKKIISMLTRQKRSVKNDESKHQEVNSTVKFHLTVDEVNEDTLKNSKLSGTLGVPKVDVLPKATRRMGNERNVNDTKNLHIEFTNKQIQNHQITDNKIDVSTHDEKLDSVVDEKIHKVKGNFSNINKNKDVSKIVVNELKKGTEIIGDDKAPVISNITFTPENDTLAAMTLIAGNLLNKLWEIEKDSSDSLEIEIIKHEKIKDLIELFKEPHTIRQESFIRNALEKISEVVNKEEDINNISLCENAKQLKEIIKETTESHVIYRKKFEENPTSRVLEFKKKFEHVKKNLDKLKQKKLNTTENKNRGTKKDDEMFANLLATITKLLLPNNKRTVQQIRQFGHSYDEDDFSAKIKRVLNFNTENVTLTPKDKLLFKYLKIAEKGKNCKFGCSHHHKKSSYNVEGDILLNLSEFFKIKSFVDLMKLVESDKNLLRTYNTTKNIQTNKSIFASTTLSINKTDSKTNTSNISSTNFSSAKEKLKGHLKAIIDDLVELQKEKGLNGNNKINIAEALPCIYNILNKDINIRKDKNSDQLEKITRIFKDLKDDLKSPTRRSEQVIVKPTSAYTWQRILENLDKKHDKTTRRSYNSKRFKSIDDIKKEIEKVEASQTETYKSASYNNILAADHLILLKTLEINTKLYTRILNDIKNSLDTLLLSPAEKLMDVSNFISNTEISLKLNEKILNVIKNHNINNNADKNISKFAKLRLESEDFASPMKYISPSIITREQILDHLIKNKIEIYIKMKGRGNHADINLSIAKKILVYLRQGNSHLAQELYKVFLVNQQEKSNSLKDGIETASSNINISKDFNGFYLNSAAPTNIDSQSVDTKYTDNEKLIKQLMDIKNMSFRK